MHQTTDKLQPAMSFEAPKAAPRLRVRFYLVSWFVFVLASPIYVLPSGNPQPADALMGLLIAILATGYVLRLPLMRDTYLIGCAFISYITIVNLVWWSIEGDSRFLFSFSYYIYDIGVVLVVISMIRSFGESFVKITKIALLTAVLLEILLSALLPGTTTYRHSITFNNPNQLAYWSVLVACCYLTLKGDQPLTLFDLGILTGTGYLIIISASRGGLIGFMALVLLAPVFQGVGRAAKVGVVLLGLGVGLVVGSDPALIGSLLEQEGTLTASMERMSSTGDRPHDSFAARGYDRLWLYPEYWLFGAGEGAYERFMESAVGNREIHSTFATVLFSYGIIGFMLFFGLLYTVFRNAPLKHLFYFIPIAFYSLTHQGLRFSFFWVFLAIVFGMAHFGSTSRLAQASTLRK